jgi:hypothetical protein
MHYSEQILPLKSLPLSSNLIEVKNGYAPSPLVCALFSTTFKSCS